MKDIILVSMPFYPIRITNLAIGLLVAEAKKTGLNVRTIYANISFAELISLDIYDFLSIVSNPVLPLAEWVFSETTGERYKSDIFLDKVFKNSNPDIYTFAQGDGRYIKEKMYSIKDIALQFKHSLAREILDRQPKIVACSSSLMQYNASVSLLKEIKKLCPDIITMMGGANCEGEMGYITKKKFDSIDFVVSGDADVLFPDLCNKILENWPKTDTIEDIPKNVFTDKSSFKANGQNKQSVGMVTRLDSIAVPDYHDYFDQLSRLDIRDIGQISLLMETSRGCFKAHKNACTFCGLNGKRAVHRTKSPRKILRELYILSKKYNVRSFYMTDTLLNFQNLKPVFIKLMEMGQPYELFFDTSSKLSEIQIKILAGAGVRWIQPGIESLHDDLLALLHKGTYGLENIALLKYGLENGIRMTWNLLYNIPGDSEKQYEEMAEWIPLLNHLQPPSFIPIRFDRFSEYHRNARLYGLELKPFEYFSHLYPFDENELNDFAYFFETNIKPKSRSIIHHLGELVSQWKHAFYTPSKVENLAGSITQKTNMTCDLMMSDSHIIDTRPCAIKRNYYLSDLENKVYHLCRIPRKKSDIEKFVKKSQQKYINNILEKHVKNKLTLKVNDKYLALANYKIKSKINLSFGKKLKTKVTELENWFEGVKF